MITSSISPSTYKYGISSSNSQFNSKDISSYTEVPPEKTEENSKSKQELVAEKTTKEVDEFFKKMKEAGGALKYVVQSNMEKINKILEEKEKELKDKLGLNSKPPLEGEALKSAQDALQAAMKDATKQLMDELNERLKQDKKAQAVHDKRAQSPLEKLLAV